MALNGYETLQADWDARGRTCSVSPKEMGTCKEKVWEDFIRGIREERFLAERDFQRRVMGRWESDSAVPRKEPNATGYLRRPSGLWLPDDDRRYGRSCDGCAEIRDALAKTSLQVAELVEQVRELVEQVRELGKRVGRLEAGIK